MEKRYFITDASKMVDVEAHVLRYWEEELMIDIPRNEMGHRYYTDFHIKLLKNIKELKEQGFQLKAIKMLLPELMEGKEVTSDRLEKMKEEMLSHLDTVETQNVTSVVNSGINAVENGNNNTKLEQFEAIIGNIVSKALENNNDALGKNVSDRVSDSVIKEMDYLMRMRDEHEEERYKRLDETIRNYQTCRKEVAAASEEKGILKKFRRKKKA